MTENIEKEFKFELATFGAGCFWCVEAIFQKLNGVEDVSAGYAGGNVKNPTYNEVCSGETRHAEVIQILFNPNIISYEKLLKYFWISHDPTTKNRQGADIGTQYRSVIFYHSDSQKKIAENSKLLLEKENAFVDTIVTEISQLSNYYKAEEYHQNYYRSISNAPYCKSVIQPKLDKIFNK